ncbi:MAG: hypothetical protein M1830_002934 [Pleopsidium flavum]|nr:MAG: hypothetical protein M1830_002934 [Pleopsidium flavum]
MRLGPVLKIAFKALLVGVLPLADAHGHDGYGDFTKDKNRVTAAAIAPISTLGAFPSLSVTPPSAQSYFASSAWSSLVIAHVTLMVIAWVFILPIGVVLSVSRSRLKLPVQFLFLVCHVLGLVAGTVYSNRTPDLYENNAHHKLGWVVTWIVLAQGLMGLVDLYAGRRIGNLATHDEQTPFIPVSIEAMAQHHRLQTMPQVHDYRYFDDSGQGTERASCSLRSHSLVEEAEASQSIDSRRTMYNVEEGNSKDDVIGKQGFFYNSMIDRFSVQSTPGLLSEWLLVLVDLTNNSLDRVILLLGFLTITTGIVTYGGVFRGNHIFSGLAHCIKGGVFFWYGLLTFSRWMGCFAELGWAWNVKPSAAVVGSRKASVPSAEFVESFVMFLYGSTNVFLEHLGAWGKAWSAQDLEHVSISIMFFGGGLCGMLVESRNIRDLLHTTILMRSSMQESHESWHAPKTYRISLNPLPGLVILLLGFLMTSHHQISEVSTMMHKQWGTLLVGFSLARAVTYVVTYISPPTSLLPSRPPSEIISAFCLISGGLIFMASSTDTVTAMETHELNTMLVFTLTVGLTAFLMAWMTLVFAIKGWALRRELTPSSTAHLEA